MATIAQLRLIMDAAVNLTNLRRDIKANLAEIAGLLEDPARLEESKNSIASLAAEYKRRLDWHANPALADDFAAGLRALAIDDYDQQLSELRAAVDGHLAVQTVDAQTLKADLQALAATITDSQTLFTGR